MTPPPRLKNFGGAFFWVLMECQLEGLGLLRTRHEPHVHLPLAFYQYKSTRFALKLILDQLVSSTRHLNRAAHAMRLHPAGDIHCIAPHVVGKLAGADHSGNDRAGINPNAEAHLATRPKSMRGKVVAHFQCHADESLRMIRATTRYTRGDHITVPDRPNLFNTIFIQQGVKKRKNLVQE